MIHIDETELMSLFVSFNFLASLLMLQCFVLTVY